MATTPRKPLKPAKRVHRRREGPKPPRPHAHKPTDQSRAVVRALVANGAREEDVCNYLKHMLNLPVASRATLAKHYAPELATARSHAQLTVAQGLYKKAVGAPAEFDVRGNKIRDEIKPEVTAQIFYLKAQAGWKDHQTVTIDPDQKPIPVSIQSLTDRQLEELEARLLKKTGASPKGTT